MVGRAPPAGKTLYVEHDATRIPSLLPWDWSIFKAGIVVLNPCSITRERFRIAFSSSQSLKLRNKILNADKNLEFWYKSRFSMSFQQACLCGTILWKSVI